MFKFRAYSSKDTLWVRFVDYTIVLSIAVNFVVDFSCEEKRRSICNCCCGDFLCEVEEKRLNKPRRVRIYKLSTFDTFTDDERTLNEAYKNAPPKERAALKKIRDEKIASYEGVRKIDRKKLYT